MFSITGKLKVKNDTQKITDSFQKREFVITDESSQYPQFILFQLVQDRVDMIDPYEPGQEIKVNFNLRGREWTNPKTQEIRYFNSLEAWKIEAVAPANQPQDAPMPSSPPDDLLADQDDDLPF